MTHTNTTNRLVSYTLFFLMVFATSAFSDSLVDTHTVNALKDFQFGQSVSSADNADSPAAYQRTGDSFINDAIMAELDGFKFGEKTHVTRTASSHKADSQAGDSFVNVKALKSYEGEHKRDCGFNC